MQTMSIQINKICRTCLALDGTLLSIYDSKGSSCDSGCVADMLGDLTNVPPKRSDLMPDKVCLACISEINRCYSFKMKCDNSDRTLRQLLNISEEIDVEPPQEVAKLKIETHSPEKEQPLKGKADTTSLRIVNQEVERMPSVESNAICSVQPEEEVDASYFVIDSVDDIDSDKHGTQNDGNTEEYAEMLYKFDDQPQENEEEDMDFVVNDSEEYKTVKKCSSQRKKEELKCPICPMTFVHPRNLTKHMRRHHNIQEEQTSTVSTKEADPEQESTQQTEENEEIEPDVQLIDECDEDNVMDDPQLLKDLMEVQISTHRCPRCGAGFAQQKSLNIHIKQKKCTNKQYSCVKCQKVFISPENLRAHLRTHKEKFICKVCNQHFSHKDEFNKHNADKHNLKTKNECPNCKKIFTMHSTLKDHMRVHSGEKPFLCSVCGKGFSQNANLKQHVMRHNKTKPFRCEECSQSFVSKGELYSHIRRHTGDHPFVCDICKAAFTTSSSLVKHKRIHTGERPYPCEFCPMRFTALNTLKNHRRTHTGEKPYKCKFCQRGFAQKSDCAIHVRTHTGERRYVCQVCGSAFQQSGTLRTHMKTHKRMKEEPEQSEQSQSSAVDEMDMDQQQENTDEQKKAVAEIGIELADDDLLNFAIEECSSENNDFSGE